MGIHAGPVAHHPPIVADIPHLEAASQNFDGITYAKGASVLKQLVAYVGFDTFIEAARVYFKRFEWGQHVPERLPAGTQRGVRPRHAGMG